MGREIEVSNMVGFVLQKQGHEIVDVYVLLHQVKR